MLKVTDLKRIKKIFEIISKKSVKKDLFVNFEKINDNIVVIAMNTGTDRARIITQPTGNFIFNKLQLAYKDFCFICDFFDNDINFEMSSNQIAIKEGSNKYKCTPTNSRANDSLNFKFNFDKSKLISTDDVFTNVDDKNSVLDNILISENELISADHVCGTINQLEQNLEEPMLLRDVLPNGTWYVEPNNNVIVSADKKVSCTITFANGLKNYPTKAIRDLSRQPLNNSFTVNAKEFFNVLTLFKTVTENLKLKFDDNNIIMSCRDKLSGNLIIKTIPACLDHPTKKTLSFQNRYLSKYSKCADSNGDLTILFDDNELTYMTRAETDKMKIFMVSLNK